jgi:hypothetical protein
MQADAMIIHRVIVIAPRQAVLVNIIDIYDKESVKRAETFIHQKEMEYGEIERILLSMQTVRIMEPYEKIPVPLQPGKGLSILAGGDFTE